jgi:hypothetical protein
MVRTFSDSSNNPSRALQVWQILIGKAHNRQTITYIALANMIGYSDARPIPNILDHIMRYCVQNDLPSLTALVVNKGTGAPGDGLTTLKDPDADREEVFNFDWYALIPPTPDEFRLAVQS